MTRRYRFVTADVFTDRPFGGNPLAVFPHAEGMAKEEMQAIAREFNFSETTFVLPPDTPGGTRRVRIFTPAAEIPFAGHPTIGTAHVLVTKGEVGASGGRATGNDAIDLILEEGVGPVAVRVTLEAGRPRFAELTAAKLPEAGPPPPDAAALARLLSLEPRDLLGGRFAPQAFSCGLPFLFVPLASREALRRARLQRPLWQETLARYWAPDCHLFAWDGPPGGEVVYARMFAPASGIEEDPATGSAAAAIAGYLAARDASGATALRWTIHQGIEMGRPSRLEVRAERSASGLTAVRVGGSSVVMTEGEFLLTPST